MIIDAQALLGLTKMDKQIWVHLSIQIIAKQAHLEKLLKFEPQSRLCFAVVRQRCQKQML